MNAEKANSFLEQAERINPNLSRVYTVKGLMYNITRKSEEAKEAFEKAIDLSPNDVNARNQYATYYYYINDYENQLEQAEMAYRLDPLSFPIAISYFTALNYNNEFDRAERLLKNIEMTFKEKNEFVINRSYMRLYLSKEDYSKAIPPIKELMKTNSEYDRFLGYCYSQLGDSVAAMNVIKTMQGYPEYYDRNYNIAVVFAGLKQNDSVFYYLDTVRNTSKRFNDRGWIFFEYLKDDPRFHALLEQHGLEKNIEE